MNSKSTRIIAGTLAFLMLLTGCQNNKKCDPSEGKNTNTTLSVQLNQYGQQISVSDIKNQYSNDTNDIMPLYNVAPDESFDFSFNFSDSDADEKNIKINDLVTVHTDSNCQEQSRIEIYNNTNENEDENIKLSISPVAPVLATDSEEDDAIYNDKLTWGNAPIYYIAVWYDMESEEIIRLETPTIIPFTIKHEAETPNVTGIVDNTSRFKLMWEPIEGATEYRVYTLIGDKQNTGYCNEPVSGAENGYSDSLILYDTTNECEFNNFAGEGHGIAIHENSTTGAQYIIGQNFCVCADFYVSAVVNGKESGLGAGVSTADLNLPYKLTDESDIMFKSYLSVDDMPLTLDVININGSITARKVMYTFEMQKSWLGTEIPGYRYEIEGTALSGYVTMDDWDAEYPETVGDSTSSGNIEPENNINKVPDSNVDTIITDEKNIDDSKTVIEQQKDNTKKHIENGNNQSTKKPDEGLEIFADSPEEEWLALNLVNGESEISLEAFPKMQDPNYLEDVIYKVYYQNPYIIGLYSFSYDYNNLTFKVNYVYDKETMRQKQNEVSAESKKIISNTITENMSDDEKRLAIYTYLENNCVYDNEALEAAKNNNFIKTEDNTYEDSFNSYGAIVNKKALCQSYAYAYKLLCTMSGIECKIITGYLNGNLPHAWNIVKIDGQWYQTDATNNVNTSGISYFLYNADTDTASLTGFTSDKYFEIDSLISQYTADGDTYEYYFTNNLVANDINQYSKILDGCLTKTSSTICIRYNVNNPSKDEVVNSVKEIYNKHNLEKNLPTLGLRISNGFIILVQK